MKKTTLLILLLFLIASCKKENACDCFKSTGDITTEIRDVSNFSSIYVSDNVNLYLTQDSVFSVKVEAGEHLISLITTEVENGSLHISNKNKCNWMRSYKPKVNAYVSLPSLLYMESSGAGTVTSTSTFTGDSLRFDSKNASGDLTMAVDVKKCFIIINTGSLNVTLNGKADDLEVYYNGYGMIHCENVLARQVLATNKSTGNLFVNVTEAIYYHISYDGNIYYYGSPSVIEGTDTGRGELLKK